MLTYQIDLSDVKKNLRQLGSKSHVRRAVMFALAKVALEIRGDVIPRTPRGIGDLMNSWRIEKGIQDDLEIGFDIIYAAYQERGKREDGTHVIQNRPAGGETGFLKNTIEDGLDKYYKLFGDTVIHKLIEWL
jgi:hypothetical protein